MRNNKNDSHVSVVPDYNSTYISKNYLRNLKKELKILQRISLLLDKNLLRDGFYQSEYFRLKCICKREEDRLWSVIHTYEISKIKKIPYCDLDVSIQDLHNSIGEAIWSKPKEVINKYKKEVINGTREAFTALIQERGIYKRLGVSVQTVSTWKIYLREGKNISLDKMEEMLLKAGASVGREKVWDVKLNNK